MFGAPVWLTAEPRSRQGERHAVAQGEQFTACGLPASSFVVLSEIPWRDGRDSTRAKACEECDDAAD